MSHGSTLLKYMYKFNCIPDHPWRLNCTPCGQFSVCRIAKKNPTRILYFLLFRWLTLWWRSSCCPLSTRGSLCQSWDQPCIRYMHIISCILGDESVVLIYSIPLHTTKGFTAWHFCDVILKWLMQLDIALYCHFLCPGSVKVVVLLGHWAVCWHLWMGGACTVRPFQLW